jgi:hypothetical protein
MKRVTVWTIGLGICLLAGSAMAQPGRNAKETTQNAREIRQDKRQLAGDIADVRWLEEQLRLLYRAHARRDRREEDRIRQKIRAFLKRETSESRRDVAQDRREVAKSAQEVRSERREVARDVRELDRDKRTHAADVRDSQKDLRRDVRDLRDDRRDLRDDVRDTRASEIRLARQKEILRELRLLQPEIRQKKARALQRERDLFAEFLRLTRDDARATAKELREDRRETREDARERRDDRRERREGN